MSIKGDRSREAILDAAMALLGGHGAARVTMAEVAGRSGLSRQAVYLHFASRSALFAALIEHVSAQMGAAELFDAALEAGSPRAVLQAAMRAFARYAARVHPIASALERERDTDEDARKAWDSRMALRRRLLREVVRRLRASGELRAGWAPAQVVDALFTLTSPGNYRELVVERGWSLAAYERFLQASAATFLARR